MRRTRCAGPVLGKQCPTSCNSWLAGRIQQKEFMKQVVAAVVFIITAGILVEQFRPDQFSLPFRLMRLQFADADTVLLMPIDGLRVSKVADTWQAPRLGGRLHAGLDIFARRGTPVLAATNGIVVRVGTNNLGGNTVTAMGAGGRLYYYAHLDRYAEGLEVGNSLLKGISVIGYVGNTGNARGTPSHLHFGVYTREGALNPLPMLTDRGLS
jgi:peptidoglycan LD-endopeptidase LytH